MLVKNYLGLWGARAPSRVPSLGSAPDTCIVNVLQRTDLKQFKASLTLARQGYALARTLPCQ